MDKKFEKVTDGEPSRDALLFRDAYFFLMESEHPAEPEKNITYHERIEHYIEKTFGEGKHGQR